MWMFTSIGFFSVVALDDAAGTMAIRARAAEDLEALRDAVLPDLDIVETPARDYRWRALVARDEWVHAATEMARRVDYPNFKSEVARVQGTSRAHRYGEVWATMYELQEDGVAGS